MAGLNINNYLSQATGTSIPGNSNMDILFGTGANNSGKSTSPLFGNASAASSDMLGISYTDYAALKSGSYGKVMNKYYSKETPAASKEDIDAYKKKLETTASKAASVSADIDSLMDMKYTEENRDKIGEKVKSFISNYNAMVKDAGKSVSTAINQKADWMSNMVEQYGDTLGQLGISVNSSDNTLSIDEEAFKKANITSIRNTFGSDVNSFSSKVLYKAEQIYSLAKTYGSSATAYTSDGTYSRNYAANYETNI